MRAALKELESILRGNEVDKRVVLLSMGENECSVISDGMYVCEVSYFLHTTETA